MNPDRRRALAAVAMTAAGFATARATGLPEPAVHRRELRTSDGVRLSLLATPSHRSNRIPLLFVPGWGMPASVWSQSMAALAADHRCIALDPRGQGESDTPDHGYTIERRAADLYEAIAPLERVVLVAWSLGVLEALHAVHLYGHDRLAALVLIDNSVGEPPPPAPTDFLKRLRADRAATVDRFARGMFATPQPEDRIDEIKRSMLKTRLEHSIALLSYPLPREHWRGIARAFPKPLAYLVTPRFAAQAQNLKAARPATQIEVFEGAGHALFVDQAERFFAVLGAFVRTAA